MSMRSAPKTEHVVHKVGGSDEVESMVPKVGGSDEVKSTRRARRAVEAHNAELVNLVNWFTERWNADKGWREVRDRGCSGAYKGLNAFCPGAFKNIEEQPDVYAQCVTGRFSISPADTPDCNGNYTAKLRATDLTGQAVRHHRRR